MLINHLRAVTAPTLAPRNITYLQVYISQRGGADLKLIYTILRLLQGLRPRIYCRNVIIYCPISFGVRKLKRWARRKKRLQRRRATAYKRNAY